MILANIIVNNLLTKAVMYFYAHRIELTANAKSLQKKVRQRKIPGDTKIKIFPPSGQVMTKNMGRAA